MNEYSRPFHFFYHPQSTGGIFPCYVQNMQNAFHFLSAKNKKRKMLSLGDLVIDGKTDFRETGYEDMRWK
jgi:hypothetical protein